VRTIDSLSTTSREHWTEIRRALEAKGISPRILNQHKDRILLEIDNVISGNDDLDTQLERGDTLLEQGIDQGSTRPTALLLAAEQNDWAKVNQLIEESPDLDITILESRLTFALAVLRRAWDVVTSFVEKGFNPDGKSADLQPAICVAASCQAWEIVKLLAGKGAHLELTDTTHHTALLRAASHRNWEAVFSLADAGADINAVAVDPNSTGPDRPASHITVLSYAALHRDWDQLSPLLERGADPNSKCPQGNPVITVAASSKCWKTVASLIQHGADIRAEDQVGRTVIDYVAASMSAAELVPQPGAEEERLELAAVAVLVLEKGGRAGRRWFNEENPLIPVLFPHWDSLCSLVFLLYSGEDLYGVPT